MLTGRNCVVTQAIVCVVDVVQQIRDIVCAESDRDHSQFDAFILFALSHGKNNYIMGTDGEGVNIYKEICDLLGRCQSLKNKPKLLFFQACRGS